MRALQWLKAAVASLALVATSHAQNVLQNPSFESEGAEAFGWTTFGNVFRERVIPVTGEYSIKLFGNFTGDVNYSGLTQVVPAAGGQEWTIGITGTNASFDAMQGGNRGLIKIEFLSAGGEVLGSSETDVVTAATPVDQRVEASVSTAAPGGTTQARLIILFEQQADGLGGAAFFDDFTASILGVGPVVVANHSFESSGGGVIAGWNYFGNAARTTLAPRTGAANLTLTTGTTSGVFQEFAALPGSQWQGSVWSIISTANSPMLLPDYVVMNIEWRDEVNNLLSFETVLVADGFSPADEYREAQISGTAPEGTRHVRFVLLYYSSSGGGSLQIDDASFENTFSPPPPPPSENLLNNAGFELALGFDFANPSNWNGFFGGPPGTFLQAFNNTGATPRSESQALVTTIRGSETVLGHNAFTGHVQIVTGLTAGRAYELAVWARANPGINNGAEFRVEWQTAGGAEVGRFNMPIQSMLTGEYQRFSFTETAPPGTARAAIVMAVQSFLNNGAAADTSVAWDDAFFGAAAPSCVPDYNGDGALDPDDLADYIACYFTAPPCSRADVNDDGNADPDDLSDFIAAYFAGC